MTLFYIKDFVKNKLKIIKLCSNIYVKRYNEILQVKLFQLFHKLIQYLQKWDSKFIINDIIYYVVKY